MAQDVSGGSFDPFRSQNLEARLRHIEDHLVRSSFSGERDETLSQGQGGTVVIVTESDGDTIPEERVDFDPEGGHTHDGLEGGKYVTLRAVELGTTVGSPADGAVVAYDGSTTDYEARDYIRGSLGVAKTASPTANLHVGASAGGADLPPFQIDPGSSTTIPVDGTLEYDGTRIQATAQTDRRVMALSSNPKTSTTTVANTVTRTQVALGTISANSFDGDQTFILTLLGRYSVGAVAASFTLIGDFGAVDAVTVTSPTSMLVTDVPVIVRFIGTVRSTGGTGTLWCTMEANINHTDVSVHNNAVTTIDFGSTISPAIDITWSAAAAANTFSCDNAFLQILN